MKRSEINAALKEMEQMIREYRFAIPPFCNFTPEEWKEKGHDYDEIRDNMLGWDITDYGLGDFDKVGFSLITIRNGNLKMKDKYTKSYAEKLLYIKEGQYSPMHFHWSKMEDIINRGGGNVHAGRGEPDLCGQPETFCRSQGAPRPGAGGTGRKKSVAADCAGGTQWNTGLPQWRGSPWFLMPCGLISLF